MSEQDKKCSKCGAAFFTAFMLDNHRRMVHPRPKPSERLIARLRSEGWTIPPTVKFKRLHPGHWQKSSGAWLWALDWPGGEIGSCERVTDLLKVKTKLVRYFGGGGVEVTSD